MKWLKNIWWLLNKAPRTLTSVEEGDSGKCTYCGSDNGWTRYLDNEGEIFILCHKCLKKAMDKILKEKTNENQ
jgi:hypothetical protein